MSNASDPYRRYEQKIQAGIALQDIEVMAFGAWGSACRYYPLRRNEAEITAHFLLPNRRNTCHPPYNLKKSVVLIKKYRIRILFRR